MNEGTLFEAVQGQDGARVVQTDADHIDFEVLIDGQHNVARLTTVQAVALAISILMVNPGHVMHQAEALDDETCAVLGQAFLLPAAQRALDREAAGSDPEVVN